MHKQRADDGSTIVTFTLPNGASATVATLHGDFNGWDGEDHVLRPSEPGGQPQLTVRLGPGTYEFRYCLDGRTWVNDPDADDYVANPFGGQNSVVTLLATDAPQPLPAPIDEPPATDDSPTASPGEQSPR